jgi:Pyridoxamine 5'-phosphate oxidase
LETRFTATNLRTDVKATNLDTIYGSPLLEWERIEERLARRITQAPGTGGPDRHTCWLATTNDDGSPHVTGVGAVWDDGAFWFQSGPGTRKARNVARDPRCALTVALAEFDLAVEGTAQRVADASTVTRLAAIWADGGWPCRVDESGVALTADYSAPSAGPPPWHVYRIEPVAATAVGTVEPGGATRWQFARSGRTR